MLRVGFLAIGSREGGEGAHGFKKLSVESRGRAQPGAVFADKSTRGHRMRLFPMPFGDDVKLGLARGRESLQRARLFGLRRGSQVVRPRSAKPLCGGSIPPRASKELSF